MDILGNDAKVFNNDADRAEGGFDRVEQLLARSLNPATASGRIGRIRHVPGCRQSAEMIDPGEVDEFEGGANSLDPPAEAGSPHRVPVIGRVSPELTIGRKIVRRNARYCDRAPILPQLEERLIRPDIGAVVRNEDRNIADDLDATIVGIRFERGPLAPK